ncbi:secretory phospholipase A2 receptor-like [Amphiprion ocellaris]|uniref:secretory phospholipase A2 receptor-like n=1 Tax=Amphiprion ocellaris TaxID=80972 RepID=UPI0016498AE6|nr:secretory phospholipase A2 receptor-like [Amphiprion ocellaris]
MRKSALRFLILTVLYQVACGLFGQNVYVQQRSTWSEARQYCRQHHTDLTSVDTTEEIIALLLEAQKKDLVLPNMWIGLYKDVNHTWKWSGGTNISHQFWPGLADITEANLCVAIDRTQWKLKDCEKQKFPFWCFESQLVLVKENKTWEEAMEHCRHLDKELVSLPSKSALIQALQSSRTVQTDRVWIALRYLANTWLWMDGSTVKDKMWKQRKRSQCPDWRHHCGALSQEEEQWDSWDCADTLNFLCY